MEDAYQSKIRSYYDSFESQLGYTLVMRNAKHFGFYPNKVRDIPETEALRLQQQQIAQNLNIRPGQLVLDGGCGRGVTACFMAKKYNVQVTGIDLLDFEINRAKRRAEKEHVSGRTNFIVMDFGKLEFPNGHFDAIYTSETLSHAQSVEKVLHEFFRVLKPGGRLVLAEYTLAPDESFSPQEMKDLDFIIEGSGMHGLKSFRHDLFLTKLSAVGFADTSEKNITAHIRPSMERLYSKSRFVYPIARVLGLEKFLFNTAVPSRLLPLVDRNLWRYSIFSASKP